MKKKKKGSGNNEPTGPIGGSGKPKKKK